MNVPETFFPVSEELVLFGLSCLLGAFMGVVYDVFRTARILLPHNKWLVMIEDIVFSCIFALCLLSFSSAAARGELRFCYAAGSLIGFVLYLLTLGNIVCALMRKISFMLRALLKAVTAPVWGAYIFLRKKFTLM